MYTPPKTVAVLAVTMIPTGFIVSYAIAMTMGRSLSHYAGYFVLATAIAAVVIAVDVRRHRSNQDDEEPTAADEKQEAA